MKNKHGGAALLKARCSTTGVLVCDSEGESNHMAQIGSSQHRPQMSSRK